MGRRSESAFLETLYLEQDYNKWRSLIAELRHRWPDHVQSVQMTLDRGDLEHKTFQTFAPRFDSPIGLDLGTRYLGAWVNNAAMTWGCRNVLLSREAYEPVAEVLESRYWQVRDVIRENFGSESYVSPLSSPVQVHSEPRMRKKRSSPTLAEASAKPIAGIDVGNTSIKVAVVREGKAIFRKRIPTFAEGVRSLEALQASFSTALAQAKNACGNLSAVGIGWFGDVRDSRPLMQAADLGEIAAKQDEGKVRAWLDGILDSTIPMRIYGDAQALGMALPVLWPRQRAYLMAFGTSVGGAYVDENGQYEDGINLVSRVVVDMSSDAPPHASTGVQGVLQRHVASRGILEAARVLSESDEHTWLADSGLTRESSGRLLQTWLDNGDSRQQRAGRAIVSKVSRWLAAGLMVIDAYYDVDVFGFTGTSMQGEVGRAMVEATREAIQREYHRSDVEICLPPFDPVFGGAIGAAYNAATYLT